MHIKEGAPSWHKMRAFRQFFCWLSMHHAAAGNLKWWASPQQWWMLMSLFPSDRGGRELSNLLPPLSSGFDFDCAIYRHLRFDLSRECWYWSMIQWNQFCWMVILTGSNLIEQWNRKHICIHFQLEVSLPAEVIQIIWIWRGKLIVVPNKVSTIKMRPLQQIPS